MGILDKSQLMKTIRVLQKKDYPKADEETHHNQIKKTLNNLRGKK